MNRRKYPAALLGGVFACGFFEVWVGSFRGTFPCDREPFVMLHRGMKRTSRHPRPESQTRYNNRSRRHPMKIQIYASGPSLARGGVVVDGPSTMIFLGKFADFKDGCGLCSPGRWSPGDRQEAPQFLRILRGKLLRVMREHLDLREVVFKLAASRYDTCPFPTESLDQARELIFQELENAGTKQDVRCKDEGQPFYLWALEEWLSGFVCAVILTGASCTARASPLPSKFPLGWTAGLHVLRLYSHAKFAGGSTRMWRATMKPGGTTICLHRTMQPSWRHSSLKRRN